MSKLIHQTSTAGICLFAILILAGCTEMGGTFGLRSQPPAPEPKADPASLNRFQEPTDQAQTTVQSALELSKKYAALSEEAAQLKQERKDLVSENSRLKERVRALDADLTQTQKELTEANDLLIEMRIELNNWKSDVLGFRDEMRKAQKLQLETLLKILKALGGETEEVAPVSGGNQ